MSNPISFNNELGSTQISYSFFKDRVFYIREVSTEQFFNPKIFECKLQLQLSKFVVTTAKINLSFHLSGGGLNEYCFWYT